MTNQRCANALSDELIEHMLDCDTCLNELALLNYEIANCPVYRDLQEQITACGGPTKPLILLV